MKRPLVLHRSLNKDAKIRLGDSEPFRFVTFLHW